MNAQRQRDGGGGGINMPRAPMMSACVRSWSFHVGSGWMGCQQAGFIMVMNPGGLSNYGCRWTERGEEGEGGGDNPAEAFYLNHSSAPFKSIWQVSPILIKRRIWQMTPHHHPLPYKRLVMKETCVPEKYFMKEVHSKTFPADIFRPVGRPQPSLPPTSRVFL